MTTELQPARRTTEALRHSQVSAERVGVKKWLMVHIFCALWGLVLLPSCGKIGVEFGAEEGTRKTVEALVGEVRKTTEEVSKTLAGIKGGGSSVTLDDPGLDGWYIPDRTSWVLSGGEGYSDPAGTDLNKRKREFFGRPTGDAEDPIPQYRVLFYIGEKKFAVRYIVYYRKADLKAADSKRESRPVPYVTCEYEVPKMDWRDYFFEVDVASETGAGNEPTWIMEQLKPLIEPGERVIERVEKVVKAKFTVPPTYFIFSNPRKGDISEKDFQHVFSPVPIDNNSNFCSDNFSWAEQHALSVYPDISVKRLETSGEKRRIQVTVTFSYPARVWGTNVRKGTVTLQNIADIRNIRMIATGEGPFEVVEVKGEDRTLTSRPPAQKKPASVSKSKSGSKSPSKPLNKK